MLDIRQFRDRIVRPVLRAMEAHSPAAEALLLGTAAQESRCTYLCQLGGGPALGLYQMEPATHDDIWNSYLAFRQNLTDAVSAWLVPGKSRTEQLVWNLAYATAMCRVHYQRVPEALPAATDVPGLARYWKRHYNTVQGAGTEDEFIENFDRARIGSIAV
jgi:hypothetical protein